MQKFHTHLIKSYDKNQARSMRVATAHGEFQTPAFMPVATRAFVNHITPEQLQTAGSQIILGGNTYHMLCSPGMEVIENAGGMHHFMGWHQPMLTDSGGFQVLSLSRNSKICTINEHGARFKHPTSGQVIELNTQTSIMAQKIIGADIIMAFDQCTPETGGREAAVQAMERTHRWLMDAKEIHNKNPLSAYGYYQALFGIIQGGSFADLREKSTKFILDLDLDGIAIGGEAIGYNMPKTLEILDWLSAHLPAKKIRYTMGLGLHPQDLIDVVAKGVDIFDCVAPTRNARHGSLYCGELIDTGDWFKFASEDGRGRILIKTARYAKDERPIMEGCTCYTCQHFSRSYLHFLFKQKLPFYPNLASIHNIHVMHEICRRMREKICATSA
jgi:queuine tRNA-ribosyltransferase